MFLPSQATEAMFLSYFILFSVAFLFYSLSQTKQGPSARICEILYAEALSHFPFFKQKIIRWSVTSQN